MGEEPFVVVLNPRAGSGRAGRQRGALEASLRRAGAARFETVLTQARGDATRIVREALAEGAKGIVAVGGDGTMNEVVHGFLNDDGTPKATDAWLGPLPFATGGDFCRGLGVPREPDAMAAHLLGSTPRRIDVGWLRYVDHEGRPSAHAFLNIASCGMGGLVDQLNEQGPKWLGGRLAFLLATLRAMARYRPPLVRIALDDGPARSTRIVTLAIANGQYFGGGMHVARNARLDDGLFDVVSAEDLSVPEQLRLLPSLYRGDLEGRPGIRYERARRVHVEPVDPREAVYLDVDGEPLGVLPATFDIVPSALWLRG